MSVFSNIPSIKYEGPDSKNPFAFKQYAPGELILGKTMREQLKFAMSYWHTMCSGNSDPFGANVIGRTYGQSDPMAIARAKAEAAFELMEKLDIDYFCFHDADIMPEAQSFAEHREKLAEITQYIKGLMDNTGKKCLWGTCNAFFHPRYMQGAGTSPSAEVFAWAAAAIKNAVDATLALGGTGYVFWGGREGYETLLNTDMAFELDNMARLMKMAVKYAREKGFAGDFFIEPKPKEPMKHQYDFDAAAAHAFLQKYGLCGDFRLNIEANHATLAGHSFEHELRYAAVNGLFGSIDANQGDLLLGWDTDQFPANIYDTTLCMLEVLRAGGFVNGGLNFDAKVRRASYEYTDIVHGYILGMDAMALGLRKAAKIIEDGRIDEFVRQRYASYQSAIGQRILSGQATLEELEAYTLENGEVLPHSGRQEYLESVLNQVLWS